MNYLSLSYNYNLFGYSVCFLCSPFRPYLSHLMRGDGEIGGGVKCLIHSEASYGMCWGRGRGRGGQGISCWILVRYLVWGRAG